MDKYLWGGIWSVAAAASGSLIYIMGKDLYKNHIDKSKNINEADFKNIKTYLNPGLILGLSLGITNVYLGKPIINYLLPNSNHKMIKN